MLEAFVQFLISYGGITAVLVGTILVLAVLFFTKGYRLRVDLGPR